MPRRSKYTKDLLAPMVSATTSMRQLLDNLGLRCTGGNYRQIRQKLLAHGIDTSHWTGQGWAKGETKESSSVIQQLSQRRTIPDDEIFVVGSTYCLSNLGYRLRQSGRPYVCENCGVSDEWQGGKLTLHVDHINGIISDATKENLRFLCPNCHQQLTSRFAKAGPPRPSRSKQRLVMEEAREQRRQQLPKRTCPVCTQQFQPKNKPQQFCSYECSHRASHRTEHPSKEELLGLITTLPTTQVADQFGVSDNAVKKWAVGYGIWDQRINQRPRSRQ